VVKYEISVVEFVRMVNKLMTESIPVKAVFISESGAIASVYGFVDSISVDLGLVISATQGMPSLSSSISVPMGNPVGAECAFSMGTEEREDVALEMGDTALATVLPYNNRLILFFTLEVKDRIHG
jgi:hypothetical protein